MDWIFVAVFSHDPKCKRGKNENVLLKDWRRLLAIRSVMKGTLTAHISHSYCYYTWFAVCCFLSCILDIQSWKTLDWRTQCLYSTINRLTLSLSTLCVRKIRPNIKQTLPYLTHTTSLKLTWIRRPDPFSASVFSRDILIKSSGKVLSSLAILAILRSCSSPVYSKLSPLRSVTHR